ncbi:MULTISPECIES: PspA/IM30 family protein [unclassified Arthrobacter]|uniref:PspA/IM30 family protein n=1 Tax=unclassified Arthrobacter TaxID=235627 RepID=UPI00159E23D9|nr:MULTISPECIES: hypothetical protein [unclassified Arthrobacter]MCQ9164814.1 hypothetical protein [Arthrobacter sp. STN4]NVM98738.1 hypothetical protein [Arthrobacter sp. SDTb3-6]
MAVFGRLGSVFRRTPPAGKHDAVPSGDGQLTVGDAQLKQLAALARMRRGVADVSVSRQRLDLQAADLKKAMDALAPQAAGADPGAAQTARSRMAIMAEQHGDLLSQRDALAAQEEMLTAQLVQLQARVSGFNVTAETLKAAQAAAEARHSIARSLKDLHHPGPPPSRSQ